MNFPSRPPEEDGNIELVSEKLKSELYDLIKASSYYNNDLDFQKYVLEQLMSKRLKHVSDIKSYKKRGGHNKRTKKNNLY